MAVPVHCVLGQPGLRSITIHMRQWAEEKGRFIALDDFYPSLTYLEEPQSGQPVGASRAPQPLPALEP